METDLNDLDKKMEALMRPIRGSCCAEVVDDEEEEESEIHDDINEAITLLKKGMILLEFLADPDLCKTLTKRERDAIDRLSAKFSDFIDDVEDKYEDGE